MQVLWASLGSSRGRSVILGPWTVHRATFHEELSIIFPDDHRFDGAGSSFLGDLGGLRGLPFPSKEKNRQAGPQTLKIANMLTRGDILTVNE